MIKILVVEDDLMNCQMLTRRLQWEGFEIVTANNGAQAIEVTKSESPDLVLMDLGLPVLSGLQAIQQIRLQPETVDLPIIALTAYALAEDRNKALAAGCNDYETKPVDFPRLIYKIRQFFTYSSSADRL